ncbi:Predicted dehydrogenase [Spirosomataceae bacterium TFI 002]|nr:Predicted dehydrogenase [Spirosomataceae bacterium TFI 002]
MIRLLLIFLVLIANAPIVSAQKKVVRMGIAGMTHDHVHQILRNLNPDGVEVVGFAEPNKELAMRHLKNYKLPQSLWYPSLEALIKAQNPEAICDFRSIKQHLETVQICAPRKIHVMVEKPLARNMADANEMITLAKSNGIELITNYETTWYVSNHKLFEMVNSDNAIGEIRKVVIHDGHKGPVEIGCSKEFLSWLTDPDMNGGGAIIDFGCYGADLMTWLMLGERPISVTAVTQTNKPEVYPKVDDEATIVVQYAKAQAIIQASWNWPYDRKDMEVYGQSGALFADKKPEVLVKRQNSQEVIEAKELSGNMSDAFTYFAAVIRKEIDPSMQPGSLEINKVAMEILDAAVQSSKTGKTIFLK